MFQHEEFYIFEKQFSSSHFSIHVYITNGYFFFFNVLMCIFISCINNNFVHNFGKKKFMKWGKKTHSCRLNYLYFEYLLIFRDTEPLVKN